MHCAKSVRIQNYSGPHFPAFGLNTERYSVSLCIQSKCGKIRTRIILNADSFYTVMQFEETQSNAPDPIKFHCVKYRNFTQFPGMKILRKCTVSIEFRRNHSKLCGNCAFPQYFYSRKLGENWYFKQCLRSMNENISTKTPTIFNRNIL